jgi:hypothetical protein
MIRRCSSPFRFCCACTSRRRYPVLAASRPAVTESAGGITSWRQHIRRRTWVSFAPSTFPAIYYFFTSSADNRTWAREHLPSLLDGTFSTKSLKMPLYMRPFPLLTFMYVVFFVAQVYMKCNWHFEGGLDDLFICIVMVVLNFRITYGYGIKRGSYVNYIIMKILSRCFH